MSRKNGIVLEQRFVLEEEKPLQDQSEGRNMVPVFVVIVVAVVLVIVNYSQAVAAAWRFLL